MTEEMKILLDALRAERDDWLDLVPDLAGDDYAVLIGTTAAAVLGGLRKRLMDALEKPRPGRPGWQNMTDIGRK